MGRGNTQLRRRCVVFGVAAGLLLLPTACSNTEQAASDVPHHQLQVAPDPALSAQVPGSLRSKTLVVATSAGYPPMEFMDSDGTTIRGMEPDLITAVAHLLGLRIRVVNASFDTIIPGLASGKYDAAISSMNATPVREKTVTMVSVRTGGSSFAVRSHGAPHIDSLADLCGLDVAVTSGSTQANDVATQALKCKSSSKPEPHLMVFQDQNQQFLALASGRAQVVVAGAPGNAWKVKTSGGRMKIAGAPYDVETTALALPKNSPLAQPMADALNTMIADGTYRKLLTEWGVYSPGIALKKSVVNPK